MTDDELFEFLEDAIWNNFTGDREAAVKRLGAWQAVHSHFLKLEGELESEGFGPFINKRSQ